MSEASDFRPILSLKRDLEFGTGIAVAIDTPQ
jgi:hypothetical protein